MQSVLRVALVDPCMESREHLKQLLADMDPVWVEAECPRYDQFHEILEQTSPNIVVIGIDSDPLKGLDLVSETIRTRPKSCVIVTSKEDDSQRILQAMRSGATEYLSAPVKMDDLLTALERIRHGGSQDSDETTNSLVIAVTGVVGAAGSTCISMNLACSLAVNPNNRVVLVDLDMVLGDADVCLDIVHNHTLLDVIENINRLDFTLLKRSLIQHSCGLYFLPHPANLAEVARISPQSLMRFINLLKATFTHVILDLSNGFRETDITAMQSSDVVLLISQLNVSSVRNVNRVLRAMGGADDLLNRINIVLNRLGTKDQTIPVDKAEEIMGKKVFWKIPNDWHNLLESRNIGMPVVLHAPKSKVAMSIKDMANELTGNKNAPEHANKVVKRRGLFSLLR